MTKDVDIVSTAQREQPGEGSPVSAARGLRALRVVLVAVVSAGLIGAVTAASGAILSGQDHQKKDQQVAQQPYEETDTLAAFGGRTIDYEPFDSPAELTVVSELIVRGTVEGIRDGRHGPGFDSIVFVVRPSTVAAGQLPPSADGTLYVELSSVTSTIPSDYDAAVPLGAAVVLYLVPAGDGLPVDGVDVSIDNPTGGRPDGQALFIPVAPQGFALQVSGYDVVWPIIGARAPAEIADALPGGSLIGR